ncbi:MAG: ribonuclease Z, partial [Candidatus Diapherotrites archaeon]|nr:ribonuclease Z [Candidatus Diapherotrites archaeon]
LIQTSCMRQRTEPLRVFGPKGIKKAVQLALELSPFKQTFDVIAAEAKGKCVRGEGFSVSAFPLRHSVPAVGFVFLEDDRVNVDEDGLRRAGLKPGPAYKRLKEGEDVEWKGKLLRARDFLVTSPGLKVAYVSDTAPVDATIEAAERADLLVHEATFAQDAAEKARETMHSTARDAGRIAREANVKQLAITHFSSRYKDADLDKLRQDAQKEFDNVIVARDFLRIEL